MDFVTFEIAKKLKEKGFPQVKKKGTLAMYNEEGEWHSLARNLDEFEYLFEDFDYHDCVCPTISQVLKWLRNEKEIYATMRLFADNGWYFIIQNHKGEPIYSQFRDTDVLYLSYEQAAIAGIEYVIDNLI